MQPPIADKKYAVVIANIKYYMALTGYYNKTLSAKIGMDEHMLYNRFSKPQTFKLSELFAIAEAFDIEIVNLFRK